MAFGGYTNSGRSDAGSLRGTQREVACECWFTSSGKLMPLMIKVKDEEGQIQAIRPVIVHSQERKRYAGILSVEFDCTLTIFGRAVRCWLIYYPDKNRWVLNFR
ncbi:MAG: hypothetical protein K2P87_15445 [Lachnospiraceae bacterium]|nr:hypothetical protein [Lachnospiraceae bacterium]